MIKLKDSEILDIVPLALKDSAEVQAISYALKRAMQKLQKYADSSSVYALIDVAQEEILDILAVELRSMYYQSDLSLDTKRQIIKNTLAWHHKAGTPSAVKQLIENIFEEAKIEEWWEYDGVPGTFNILVPSLVTKENLVLLNRMIKKVKNARSHLVEVKAIARVMEKRVFIGAKQKQHMQIIVRQEG
jgi:phage tail protein, P2 protein I family